MKSHRPNDIEKDFSLEHYAELLEAIKKTHATFSFKDASKLGREILDVERFVIMRHDVEFSLPAALRLAKADHAGGVHSTFFLLQTSDYNPFEEESSLIVREILSMGHDLGLHYDAALFEKMGADPVHVAKCQIGHFEAFFNTTVYAMSSHLPMRSGRTFAIPGVVDTYDPLYMKEIKYLSDSTQAWREGIVSRNLDKHPKIHLLTHEYIWHPKSHSWETLLLMEAKDKFDAFWRRAEKNIDTYREGLRLRTDKDMEFKKRYM